MICETIDDICHLVRVGCDDWRTYGDVVATEHDGMVLLNYTHAAQYARRWNYLERVCRGLILDRKTGEVIARPFDKFFNWAEIETKPLWDPVAITEKMDGSLGILYRRGGGYAIATRGSFQSDQAIWATAWLNKHTDLAGLPDELTLLFEIVYPGNRVVVDYSGYDGLILLAARNRFTGKYLPFRPSIEAMGREYGLDTPKVYRNCDLLDLLASVDSLGDDREGFVVEFADGERYKFKGSRYLELHRIISGLSFKNTLAAVEMGAADDIRAALPDEFHGQFDGWVKEIGEYVSSERDRLAGIFAEAPRKDRKMFALWVQAEHKPDAHYLFAMMDGKSIEPMIYKNMPTESLATKEKGWPPRNSLPVTSRP